MWLWRRTRRSLLRHRAQLRLEPVLGFLQVDCLQVDLRVRRRVIFYLYQKCVEQNRMLEVILAIPDAQSKVKRRLPSIQRGRLSSYPDRGHNTSLTDRQLLL